jgi:hypothetical protein
MKRVALVLALTVGMLAGPLAPGADAATDQQIKRAVLTTAEMLAVTGTMLPLVRDSFKCSTQDGLRSCVLLLKSPNGSKDWPKGLVGPWHSGVSIGRTPAAVLAAVADARKKPLQDGEVRAVSTATEFIATYDFFGQGYLGVGIRAAGTQALGAGCSGTKVTRIQVVDCIQSLLNAQQRKAEGVR